MNAAGLPVSSILIMTDPAAPVVKTCLLSMLNVAQKPLERGRGSHVPDLGIS